MVMPTITDEGSVILHVQVVSPTPSRKSDACSKLRSFAMVKLRSLPSLAIYNYTDS